jgi:hypothetical protein
MPIAKTCRVRVDKIFSCGGAETPSPLALQHASRQPEAMPNRTPFEPLSEADVARLVRTELDFDPPAECLPGIKANLALLTAHLRTLDGSGE